MIASDPLCLCGHPADVHARRSGGCCFARGCPCHGYWKATRLPQPPPRPGEIAVWPLVILDAERAGVSPVLLADMRARHEFGMRKYGRSLETRNGRDPLEDAYDEALDGVAYMRQFVAEAATDAERFRRHKLYELALRWVEALCAERRK